MTENKYPGKDISEDDIKTKFPLVAKKYPNHKIWEMGSIRLS